ncbi:hypothetical protein N186_09245 [Thermofilum adornatum]|uniref:PIN domain-containing protein n=2 Tax=Thermofilum adornatum TaxID=1365176 RepID=S5Z9Z4_9CREN|nr:hypothetical protein N186_09245 [Thermofilum adornatum]
MLSRRRKDECKLFLKMLRDGEILGTVTDFSVHSIMVLLDRLNRPEKLKTFLLSLTGYRGLAVHYTSIAEEVRAVELAREKKLDIDDALQYAVALSIGADAIVSFDEDFSNLEIPRLEPVEIIDKRKSH